MRVATIDLGTNAVRFDIHQIQRKGPPLRLHRERLPVRLGEGVFQTGRLSPRAMERTRSAFLSFSQTCRDLKVQKVTAFGTSALRDSSNSDGFLRDLKRATGIDVRVISGREEARLIAQGVLAHKTDGAARTALVDIGGGSVEIILCRGRRVVRSTSFKLGGARLQQVFLKTVPPSRAGGKEAPVAKLRRHVRSLLAEGAPRGDWPRVDRILGSGGTLRTLARIHRAGGGTSLNAKQLARWSERFAGLSPAGLARIPGMDPKRATTLLAGTIVLGEVARVLEARRIEATDYSLRDGMLEEEVRAARRGGPTSLGFHLNDVAFLSRRWGLDPRHLDPMARFAKTLFVGLSPFHCLAESWRDYFVAACWLQDSGEMVSPVHHERHSSYLVKNADIPGVESWELEFIAQLILWHKGGKVGRKDLPLIERMRRGPFLKLLSLIRIVDALDKPRAHVVSLRRVIRTRGTVTLALGGERSALDLAILRLEQKKELFEKLFRTRLVARAD